MDSFMYFSNQIQFYLFQYDSSMVYRYKVAPASIQLHILVVFIKMLNCGILTIAGLQVMKL